MSLIDCKCGKPVRLGALKIKVNRKSGVLHYIAHRDGSVDCEHLTSGNWDSTMLKPYPRAEEDRPYFQMMQRWGLSDGQ
jgi:hypothetical protein